MTLAAQWQQAMASAGAPVNTTGDFDDATLAASMRLLNAYQRMRAQVDHLARERDELHREGDQMAADLERFHAAGTPDQLAQQRQALAGVVHTLRGALYDAEAALVAIGVASDPPGTPPACGAPRR